MDALPSTSNVRPLAGKHVVITRAQSVDTEPLGEDGLPALLTQLGARVSQIPLIEVRPVPWHLDAAMAWDWLFFTSQNAVHAFFQAHPGGLDKVLIAVVGPATGAALVAYGQQATFTAPQFNAESAARAFCDTYSCEGLRILWPCGNLANQALLNILSEAGADVTLLVVYETVLHGQASPEEAALWTSSVDVVVLASPSAVAAFQQVCQSLLLDWSNVVIACLGPKTAEAARTYLGRVDIQPEVASMPALAEAIKVYYQNREISG